MPVKTARWRLLYNETMEPQPHPLTARELKDLKILALFTAVYCRTHHDGPYLPLPADRPELRHLELRKYPVCGDCAAFLGYAFERRLRCPLEEKPACKHCPAPCYRPGHREKVREIMRFSGPYLIRRGRLDLLWYSLF
jgi:hypothetical protein